MRRQYYLILFLTAPFGLLIAIPGASDLLFLFYLIGLLEPAVALTNLVGKAFWLLVSAIPFVAFRGDDAPTILSNTVRGAASLAILSAVLFAPSGSTLNSFNKITKYLESRDVGTATALNIQSPIGVEYIDNFHINGRAGLCDEICAAFIVKSDVAWIRVTDVPSDDRYPEITTTFVRSENCGGPACIRVTPNDAREPDIKVAMIRDMSVDLNDMVLTKGMTYFQRAGELTISQKVGGTYQEILRRTEATGKRYPSGDTRKSTTKILNRIDIAALANTFFPGADPTQDMLEQTAIMDDQRSGAFLTSLIETNPVALDRMQRQIDEWRVSLHRKDSLNEGDIQLLLKVVENDPNLDRGTLINLVENSPEHYETLLDWAFDAHETANEKVLDEIELLFSLFHKPPVDPSLAIRYSADYERLLQTRPNETRWLKIAGRFNFDPAPYFSLALRHDDDRPPYDVVRGIGNSSTIWRESVLPILRQIIDEHLEEELQRSEPSHFFELTLRTLKLKFGPQAVDPIVAQSDWTKYKRTWALNRD